MSRMEPWYRGITPEQWRALAAAKLGWMLDAMDFMLYAVAIGELRAYFGFNDATAGLLGTVTLAMSAAGGLFFGAVSDRFGRTRALMATVTVFSLASLGASTSQTVLQLMFWRAVLGIGMGGEWASGAVLVSETWPAAHRNKAVSIMQSGWAIGYILAAAMAALVLGNAALGAESWRYLFVLGVLPALFAIWVRRNVKEPAAWVARRETRRAGLLEPFREIFGGELRARTLLAILLSSSVQFAYWGIFFWLPGFLSRPIDQGGAGMGVVGSLAWIIPVQIGAYFGYLTFSLFGSLIAELFPTAVRGTGQGTTYNAGRLLGALAPYSIGVLATLPGVGIGAALAATSAFFLLSAVLIFALPDRSQQPLEA